MFQLALIFLSFSCLYRGLRAESPPYPPPLNDPCLKLYKNFQLYGGIAQKGVIDQEKCWVECQKTTGCKAFEWLPYNLPNFKCFLFTTSKPPPRAKRPDVYHYVLTCQCAWKEYLNSLMYGGKEQPYNTLANCQNACIGDKMCNSVEWKGTSAPPQCFFFKSTSVPLYKSSGINHYIWRCTANNFQSKTTPFLPGIPTTSAPGCFWMFKRNYRSSRVIPKPASSLSECKKACIDYNNCADGLEWKPRETRPMERCGLNDRSNQFFYFGSDHYMYNCSTSILNVWKVEANLNSHNGVLQTSVYSLDECKEHCVSLTSCQYGFDWNHIAPLGQGCWISSNADLHPTIQQGIVDHYSLKLISAPVPEPINNCTWMRHANKNSPGGTPKPQHPTLDSCKAFCIRAYRPDCKGIDWNPSSDTKCWFSVKEGLSDYPSVYHYALKCLGESTPTPNPDGSTTIDSSNSLGCGYQKYPNSSSDNGVPKPYESDGDCRDQCTVQTTCRAYEWRTNDPNIKCLFYSTADKPKYNNMTAGRTYYPYKICF